MGTGNVQVPDWTPGGGRREACDFAVSELDSVSEAFGDGELFFFRREQSAP